MASPGYLSVKGARQGQFKGESTRANRNDWIPILAFEMSVESPRDAATGQASGKRQYKPVKITKEWGEASPQALAACATNEVLTTVALEFLRIGPDGNEYTYQTVNLTNAAISGVFRFKGEPPEDAEVPSSDLHPEHSGSQDTHELEEWEFVFQKIEVTDKDGATTFADDWAAP
jgi:type VI secretion system secreted protein Hcp